MQLPSPFLELEAELSTAFVGALTPGQRRVLAAWVAGTVVAGTACQSLVTAALVETLGVGETHAVRQALREWLYDWAERSAPGRCQVEPRACFGPLLGRVLWSWSSRNLALALDVAAHTDRLTAIVVSVLCHGRAIPVAWQLLAGNRPGGFIEPILDLIATLATALSDLAATDLAQPSRWRVSLAADRGLWGPRLADRVAAAGWIALLRVQRDVSIWPGRGQRVAAERLVAGPGHAWVGRATVHKHKGQRRIQTVVVVWALGHAEPWVIFTTLPPREAGRCWHGLRMWIEVGFRDLKRMGWQWERTRRTTLIRVARHWLVLAVATVWVLRHAGLPAPGRRNSPISAFQRGRLRVLGRRFGRRLTPPAPVCPPRWPDHDALDLQLTVWSVPPYLPGSTPAPPVNLPL